MVTGGMDSTTLMYHALSLNKAVGRIGLVSFDYGQAAFAKQLEMIEAHQKRLDLDRVVPIKVATYPWQLKGKSLLTGVPADEINPLEEWDQLRYEKSFIEGRNMLMVSYALAYASAHGFHEVWAGYLYSELEWEKRRSYKLLTGDNSPQFVDGMNIMAQMGFSRQVRLRALWYEKGLSKQDVYDYGKSAFQIDYSKTYSCYYPEPCGKCDNCLLRAQILKGGEK